MAGVRWAKTHSLLAYTRRYAIFAMLSVTSRDVIFARAFLILTWNLMSRASNTPTVCLSHMEFFEDALCIFLPKMKNDQLGQ
jgi:hypothetical protein